MQTRAIALLAQKLRNRHRSLKSWPQVAEQLKVHTPDGDPSPGLAFAIARGYMPGDLVMRRLIFAGAIPAPPPIKMVLDLKTRRAFINAFKNREPLPDPDAKTVRMFSRWLHRSRLLRGRRVSP